MCWIYRGPHICKSPHLFCHGRAQDVKVSLDAVRLCPLLVFLLGQLPSQAASQRGSPVCSGGHSTPQQAERELWSSERVGCTRIWSDVPKPHVSLDGSLEYADQQSLFMHSYPGAGHVMQGVTRTSGGEGTAP